MIDKCVALQWQGTWSRPAQFVFASECICGRFQKWDKCLARLDEQSAQLQRSLYYLALSRADRDTENECAASGGQSRAPGELIGEASAMPVDGGRGQQTDWTNSWSTKNIDGLTSRFDSVKEDNLVLKSENQVLSQCTENVKHASSSFQQMSPRSKKCSRSTKKWEVKNYMKGCGDNTPCVSLRSKIGMWNKENRETLWSGLLNSWCKEVYS